MASPRRASPPPRQALSRPGLFRPTHAVAAVMTGQFLYRRRSILSAGLAALLLAPERSTAQQPQSKIPRVGILTVSDNERVPMFGAFREGLRDLGYVEGRNIILEFRLARG